MTHKLINKIANKLDSQEKFEKADRIDNFIMKFAQKDREPTIEELMAEEEWLEEEGIDPYSMTDEDAMHGLEGEDRDAAEEYLRGKSPESIKEMIEHLQDLQEEEVESELDQQRIIQQLSDSLIRGKEMGMKDPARIDRGQFIVPEASNLISDLTKLADMLDEQGMYKESDYFTNMLEKIATDGPDDFFDSHDDDDLDEFDEPNLDDMGLEDEDDMFYTLLGFVENISKGMFMDINAAQIAAKELIKGFDTSYSVPGPELGMAKPLPEDEPDNILPFPGA